MGSAICIGRAGRRRASPDISESVDWSCVVSSRSSACCRATTSTPPDDQIFLDSLIVALKTWQPVTEAIIAQRDAEATDASC